MAAIFIFIVCGRNYFSGSLGRSAAAAEIRAVLLSVEQDRLGGGVAVTRHASHV